MAPKRSRPRRAPIALASALAPAMTRAAAILGLVAGGGLGLVGTAHASGLGAARFGGEHGHPTTDNPTAIYYNPAGIALKPGTRIMVDATMAGRWASYQRPEGAINDTMNGGTPPDGVAANAGTAKLANFLVSPFIGAHSDFGTKIFSAGAALYFPFGGQAVWGQNSQYANNSAYPGAHDGVQRWYTIDGKIRSMYITGAMAFNIPQIGLSIGVTGSAIRSETDTIRARNADGSDDLLDTTFGGRKEGRSWLKASGWQGGFSIGAIWTWQQRLWIGASYTSQPNVVGGMTLKGKLYNALASPMLPTVAPAELTQTLPDIIRLGFRVRPTDRVELRLFADYTRWSVFDKQCVLDASVQDRKCNFVGAENALSKSEDFGADGGKETAGTIQHLPRFWKDAGGVRAGASYWFTPQVESYLGLGYDSSAVRPQTLDAALMDMNKMSFSIGTRWQIIKQFAIALTVTDIAYFKVDTKGKNVLNQFQAPTRQADANGVYKQNILVGNMFVDVSF